MRKEQSTLCGSRAKQTCIATFDVEREIGIAFIRDRGWTRVMRRLIMNEASDAEAAKIRACLASAS